MMNGNKLAHPVSLRKMIVAGALSTVALFGCNNDDEVIPPPTTEVPVTTTAPAPEKLPENFKEYYYSQQRKALLNDAVARTANHFVALCREEKFTCSFYEFRNRDVRAPGYGGLTLDVPDRDNKYVSVTLNGVSDGQGLVRPETVQEISIRDLHYNPSQLQRSDNVDTVNIDFNHSDNAHFVFLTQSTENDTTNQAMWLNREGTNTRVDTRSTANSQWAFGEASLEAGNVVPAAIADRLAVQYVDSIIERYPLAN